jgi:uncharacterized membrane protein YuzA (DUF378 family)
MKFNTKFLKGLFMALIGAIMPIVQTTPIIWSLVIVTIIGTAGIYFGKNAITLLKSNSPEGTLKLVNWISAGVLMAANAILSISATLIIDGHVNWVLMGTTVISVGGTYLVTTVFEGRKE